MDKDKSILEKITDTVKDIANIAADAVNHALTKHLGKSIRHAPKYRQARGAAPNPFLIPGLRC